MTSAAKKGASTGEKGASATSRKEFGADISNRPFEFNAPVHNAHLFHMVDFSSDKTSDQIEEWMKSTYRQTWAQQEKWSLAEQKNLRLGRITLGNEIQNFSLTSKTRWGFRFHFNPPTWSGGSVFNQNIIPDFKSEVPLIVSVGLEVISFTIMLDRSPDVLGGTEVRTSDYTPEIALLTLSEIQKRGTNYDLEYLYRCANVQTVTTMDDQNTADFGILLPNICYLTLGKQQYRGRFVQIVAGHTHFSEGMVPIRTQVQIQFQRVVEMKQAEFMKYAEGGGWDVKTQKEDSGDKNGGGGGGDDDDENGGGGGGGGGGGNKDPNYDTGGKKASGLNQEQSDIARHIIKVAKARFGKNGTRAAIIGLIAGYQESTLKNLNYGDRDSLGVFQQRPGSGWGKPAEIRNVKLATQAFFGLPERKHTKNPGLMQVHGWSSMSYTLAAQAVQRSAYPYAYARWTSKMTKVYDELKNHL